ncbi:Hsp20/alpha crystallin family protein [Paenibacillus hodogayensis]|uniref:Hsp20/alpha crystallin family protein n=1 Tax=Paenibacillus hodogayensis TaxID=279208 RepID=A0ABV5W404_9BACL
MSEAPHRFWKKLRSQANQTLGDQFWNDIAGLLPNAQPRTDVFQTDDRFIVVIELPGCRIEESVKLSVHKNMLHIRGDLVCPYPVEEDGLLVAERFFGPFHRKIPLPPGTAAEGMRARSKDGLLTVEFFRTKPSDEAIDIAIDRPDAGAADDPPLPERPEQGG